MAASKALLVLLIGVNPTSIPARDDRRAHTACRTGTGRRADVLHAGPPGGSGLRGLIEDADGRVFQSILNGKYLELPPRKESDLVAVLRRHGHKVRRDDALIARLGGN